MAYSTEYERPSELMTEDDEVILDEMLSDLPANFDKTIGGFAHDFLSPTAYQIATLAASISDCIQIYFPTWSYAGFLDMIAEEVGLERKEATYAETTLTVTGTEGTIIPSGFLFATVGTDYADSEEFEATEEVTIDETGIASVPVRSTDAGTKGNVPANTIVLMVSTLSGITGVTNEEAAEGGYAAETDDELRERIRDRDINGNISYTGCIADYKRWAMEVSGVGSVVVVPEWEGPGTGTVKLIVMSSEGQPVADSTIEDVYNHIMSPGDENTRLAPIGAILTVVTSTLSDISYSATIIRSSSVSVAEIEDAFRTALLEYYQEVKEDSIENGDGIGYIRYTRIGRLISEITGVVDYNNLLINGSTGNVMISENMYPNTLEIEFSDGGVLS